MTECQVFVLKGKSVFRVEYVDAVVHSEMRVHQTLFIHNTNILIKLIFNVSKMTFVLPVPSSY